MRVRLTPTLIRRLTSYIVSYALLILLCAPFALPVAGKRPTKGERRTSVVPVSWPRSQTNAGSRTGELLVRFRAGVSEQDKSVVFQSHGARRKKQLRGDSGIEKLELLTGQDPKTAADLMRVNPQIEFVEPNFLIKHDQFRPELSATANILGPSRSSQPGKLGSSTFYGTDAGVLNPNPAVPDANSIASASTPQAPGNQPSDPRFGEQWALSNTGQTGGQVGSDINVTAAWRTTTGSALTVIAVIDSGIDFSHPDLTNNKWTNAAPSSNGDLNGWDYITDSGVIRDEQGHGTAIAGIIAAQGNNALGVSGVMWRASLMSLRVLDNTGTGDVADAVEAMDYAVTHGAQVINISWGTDGESLALKDAIERAIRRGVVVVCSAGNNGQDVDSTPNYPASFGSRDLIAVASTDGFDQPASWSNWGRRNVAIAAPGIDILTTQMGGGYWFTTGTSVSAPLVSGVAGLLKTVRPWVNARVIAKAIVEGARQTLSLRGKVSSKGVVSASGALASLGGSPYPPPPGGDGATPPRPPNPPRGGPGPGGSFATTPPQTTSGAPGANLPDLDQMRGAQPIQPKAKTPIHSNIMCGDCDPQGGGGGGGYYPPNDPNFSTARMRPINRTGPNDGGGLPIGDDPRHPPITANPGSRNFHWSLPLLSLPGRAGLDLNLTLAYDSLVWTKDGSYIKFNADLGSPAVGFNLGFPTLQQRFYDSLSSIYSYIMVTPSGGRVEMTQVGSSTIYEALDGSYMQLDASNALAPIVKTSDGTILTFISVTINNEFRCTEIKDRNGNYITATYNTTNGHLLTITDTLARGVTFVYYADGNLQAIRQTWAGVSHDWATFSYGQVWVAPNFGGGLLVNGANNNYVTVLTQVSLHDGSYYTFAYNAAFAQVNRINHYAADSHLLAYTSYNVASGSGQTDCPRFTERRDWAQSWNGDTDGVPATSEEALTQYSAAADNSWSQQTTPAPDSTIYKEFYYTSGWQTGLTSATEVWWNSIKQKWTTTTWTQDDTSLTYKKNPRPTETNIYDAAPNQRRSRFSYTTFTLPSGTSCSLLSDIYEYAANATTVLRRSHTDYRYDSAYLNRRIIGLPAVQYVCDGSQGEVPCSDSSGTSRVSKVAFDYDWANWPEHLQATPQTAIRHDQTNYSSSFIYGRGNLVWTGRYNLNDGSFVEHKWGYYETGTMIFERDALAHQTNIEYADSFSDGVNRNSFAYPSAVIDDEQRWQPSPQKTKTEINYDFGAITKITGLSPNSGQTAPYVTYTYDSAGRVQQITNGVNNGYTRWVYPTNQNLVQAYSTVVSGLGEAYSAQITDGAGRVRGAASDLPPTTGHYSGQYFIYDNMGRMVQQSNPIEMDGNWNPIGVDDTAWLYTVQTYDWKGRPSQTTNPDGSTRQNTYGGCGCAGGEVVTVRDEGGRQRRMTMDVLGRLSKVEELNWGGQTVYSTTNYTYNARDQITNISQQNDRPRTFEYDGHGRLSRKTTPEQGLCTYTYFADDQLQTMTDARGATTTFGYNTRHLVTSITYGVPTGVAGTPNVSFGYDVAGNRTSMTDGLGSKGYGYDQLSRLTSETRTFTTLSPFALSYQYNLAGEPTSITGPSQFGSVNVGYSYDKIGRVTSVSGSGYAGLTSYVDSISYRAFGAAKQVSYHNSRTLSLQYNNRMWLSRWDLPKPGGGSNSTNALGYAYSYNQYGEGNTGRPDFADSLYDSTIDRSWDYDHVGHLITAYTGTEANNIWGNPDGPYAESYSYDVWGNMTSRLGWGSWNTQYSASFNSKNQMVGNQYDAAGNLTNDGLQAFTYDAVGKQVTSSWNGLQQGYDGGGLRGKKVMDGATTYYLRSSVLGGEVLAEINSAGGWTRGYVYLGGQMLALQQNSSVTWVHQEPLTKGQRLTDSAGNIVSTVELDPWGGDTSKSSNSALQPHPYTTYERDTTGGIDEAQQRRYHGWWSRFDQPDPYDGSYDSTNPQSLNRYSYVQNDPVNFIDPSGLVQLEDGTDPTKVRGYGIFNVFLFGGIVIANGYLINDRQFYAIDWFWSAFPGLQNIVPLTPDQLSAVRKGIAGYLTDACAKFINQVVSGQTGKPFDAKIDLLTAFDSIRDGKGGFFFGGTAYGGDARGSLAGGTAEIRINSNTSGRLPMMVGAIVGELIHAVSGSDKQLSGQVRDLKINVLDRANNVIPYPTDRDNRNLAFSTYFHQAVNNACLPSGVRK